MSELEDLKAQAKKKSEATESKTWKPTTEGEELAGHLREIDYAFTEYGEGYVITIEDEDNDLFKVWCTGAVLSGAMLDASPALDSPIVILYEGSKKNKAGTFNYKAYQVAATTSNFDQWKNAREIAMAKRSIKENEATGGGGLPADNLESPF